ncbi:MAG: four helix bundle protein [Patescibacteria group bacterium]
MTGNEYKNELYRRIYLYGLKIIQMIERLPKDRTSDVIGKQLLRSGTSVSANVIEAKSASSKKDYINFYHYALKSANESKLWICYLRDSKKLNEKESNDILKETEEISKILAASIITMKNKNKI